jgi:hypothetical protein
MSDHPVYCPQDEDFLAGVVVDHLDGVVGEALIDEHFASGLELA